MAGRAALFAALCAEPAASVFRLDRAFLSTDMQPSVVAKTLSHVEDEWKAQARVFIKCELSESKADRIKDCDDTPADFTKSCSTVVSAAIQGSGGDARVMKEYMGNVCNQDIMASWHQASCLALSDAIGVKMSASTYDNRAHFQTRETCDEFWTSFLTEQKALYEEDMVAQKEQEKKATIQAAQDAKEAKDKAEKEKKDLEEAERGDTAKEEVEIAVEKAKLKSHEQGSSSNHANKENLEAAKVEESAARKIAEADELESEPLGSGEKMEKVEVEEPKENGRKWALSAKK